VRQFARLPASFRLFSSVFAVHSLPIALTSLLAPRGPDVAPSEDYFHWPPCAAGFFGEGRQSENARAVKKTL
jgi:hypothetical protein